VASQDKTHYIGTRYVGIGEPVLKQQRIHKRLHDAEDRPHDLLERRLRSNSPF
jgi:hypothetical protein